MGSADEDLPGRVTFEVHRRFLTRFVRPGQRVLEIGAGPGRFTAELAALGARVVVTDFSAVQLELNRAHISSARAESAVELRELLDACDTSRYAEGECAVVPMGQARGWEPLSAVRARALAVLDRVSSADGATIAVCHGVVIQAVAGQVATDHGGVVLR